MESVYENGGFIGKTSAFDDPEFYQIEGTIPRGEAEFTTPGTTSWTAPTDVTSVCVVAVGGGGGGQSGNGSGGHGGGGGGLGWKNNIPVIPGVSYTVAVGAGGARATVPVAGSGANSYFIDATTVAGLGGQGGRDNLSSAGGGFEGDGGGNGGSVPSHTSTADATGGGGAGGYSGNGGTSGSINTDNAVAGSGGGGGGGGAGGSSDAAGGGGGVGIYGEGSNGTAGVYNGTNGTGGGGGSGGTNAPNPTSTANPATGGTFGGGGGGAELTNENGNGGGGAVRIIWGGERAFPSTNTANGQGTTTGLINGNQKNSGIWNLKAVYNAIVFRTEINAIFDSMDDATIPLGGLNFKTGDNLFVCIYNENTTGGITMNSSGWTLIDSTYVASIGRGSVYYKVSDGTETSVTITPDAFTTTGAIVVAVDALYTYQTVLDTFLTIGSPNPPSLTGFSTGDISLVFGAYGDDVVTVGVPSGYTLLARGTSGSTGTGMSCAVAWRNNVSGTVDPGTFSGGNDENYAAHIRLSI